MREQQKREFGKRASYPWIEEPYVNNFFASTEPLNQLHLNFHTLHGKSINVIKVYSATIDGSSCSISGSPSEPSASVSETLILCCER